MERRQFIEGGILSSLLGAIAGCSSPEEPSALASSIRIIPTIEVIRQLEPQEGVVYVKGYHQPGDGGGGVFNWSEANTREPDGGTVLASAVHPYEPGAAKEGRWLRIQEQHDVYSARHFGAHPNREDNTAAIQAAIDAAYTSGGTAYIASGTYRIAGVLMMKPGMALEGAAGASTTLIKTSRRKGPDVRRYNRVYDVYDEYDVDSIISIDRPNESLNFAQYVTLRNLRLNGLATETGDRADRNAFGVYAPRLMKACIENVTATRVEKGFYFREIIVSRVEQCVASYVDIGFQVSREAGGGTSTTFQTCFASRADQWGYLLRSLSYSSLNSCACDHAGAPKSGGGYFIGLGHGISLTSCGCEASYGPVLRIAHSEVTVTGFKTHAIKGGASASDSYIRIEDAKVTFIGCKFDEMTDPMQAKNARYLGQSQVVFIASDWPRGGAEAMISSESEVSRQ